jgi:pimeloyl-ACP methyl ester carboxylesterase
VSAAPIPFLDFSGTGSALVFLHANGFPPACYRDLLTRLAGKYRVVAMNQRPLWPDSQPRDIRDWRPFSAELIRFLDQIGQTQPATVIGHSLGGIAALRAALIEPDRFRALILLDPVLLPPGIIVAWNIVRALGLAHYAHPLIPTTLNRRQSFDDLENLFKSYRRYPVFKYMDDKALRIYIEGIVEPSENGGYTLRYSAEWESRVYYTSIWRDLELWRGLKKLKTPTLIVRGAETDTFFESTARRVQKINPAVRVETLEGATHLVPLERPAEVASQITNFLNALEEP